MLGMALQLVRVPSRRRCVTECSRDARQRCLDQFWPGVRFSGSVYSDNVAAEIVWLATSVVLLKPALWSEIVRNTPQVCSLFPRTPCTVRNCSLRQRHLVVRSGTSKYANDDERN